ncbi:MAG: TetR/AcrR family transcriptional regulator [Solirubrobacterales bacterium]
MATKPRQPENRRRIAIALAESLSEKGLRSTQVNDIVKRARISKRTFYECFPDKESAFVDLIREWNMQLQASVERSMDPRADWDVQIEQAIDTYIEALAAGKGVATTVSRELYSLGERGAALQREGIDMFAALMVRISQRPESARLGVEAVSMEAAVMLIGGVREIISRAIQDGDDLTASGETVKSVIKAVVMPRGMSDVKTTTEQKGKP